MGRGGWVNTRAYAKAGKDQEEGCKSLPWTSEQLARGMFIKGWKDPPLKHTYLPTGSESHLILPGTLNAQ